MAIKIWEYTPDTQCFLIKIGLLLLLSESHEDHRLSSRKGQEAAAKRSIKHCIHTLYSVVHYIPSQATLVICHRWRWRLLIVFTRHISQQNAFDINQTNDNHQEESTATLWLLYLFCCFIKLFMTKSCLQTRCGILALSVGITWRGHFALGMVVLVWRSVQPFVLAWMFIQMLLDPRGP